MRGKHSGKHSRDEEFADLPPGFPSRDYKRGVPDVQVENPHWKVGDGMVDAKGKPDYIIGQIAIVQIAVALPGLSQTRMKYDIVFFDTAGDERGRLHMTQD